VGIEADSDRVEALLKELEGKDITEVIASGVSKLASVPAGGGGVAAAGGGTLPGYFSPRLLCISSYAPCVLDDWHICSSPPSVTRQRHDVGILHDLKDAAAQLGTVSITRAAAKDFLLLLCIAAPCMEVAFLSSVSQYLIVAAS